MQGPKFTPQIAEKYHTMIQPFSAADLNVKTPEQAREIAIRLEANLTQME